MPTPTPTPQQVLDLKLNPKDNFAGAETVRDYLIVLLGKVWARRDHGLSVERLLGSAGWEYDLIVPLIRVGWVVGSLDAEGYVERLERSAANALIADAIAALGEPSAQGGVTPRQHARHAALDLAVTTHTRSVRFLENAEEPGDLADEVLSTARRFAAFIDHGCLTGARSR